MITGSDFSEAMSI